MCLQLGSGTNQLVLYICKKNIVVKTNKNKNARMEKRADRLTAKANKITGKGSTSLNLVSGDKSATIKTSANTKKSDRLLNRASVLRGKAISDPFEKARYISNLPEGTLKKKLTKQGPIDKIHARRVVKKFNNSPIGPIKR